MRSACSLTWSTPRELHGLVRQRWHASNSEMSFLPCSDHVSELFTPSRSCSTIASDRPAICYRCRRRLFAEFTFRTCWHWIMSTVCNSTWHPVRYSNYGLLIGAIMSRIETTTRGLGHSWLYCGLKLPHLQLAVFYFTLYHMYYSNLRIFDAIMQSNVSDPSILLREATSTPRPYWSLCAVVSGMCNFNRLNGVQKSTTNEWLLLYSLI